MLAAASICSSQIRVDKASTRPSDGGGFRAWRRDRADSSGAKAPRRNPIESSSAVMADRARAEVRPDPLARRLRRVEPLTTGLMASTRRPICRHNCRISEAADKSLADVGFRSGDDKLRSQG